MTDRYCAYLVVMDEDRRTDDAEATITTLSNVKGVVEVRPVVAGVSTTVLERMAVRSRLKALFAQGMDKVIRDFDAFMDDPDKTL
jgi:hypothetical protein